MGQEDEASACCATVEFQWQLHYMVESPRVYNMDSRMKTEKERRKKNNEMANGEECRHSEVGRGGEE